MNTILIIGGAGTFGARIVQLLAETGQFDLLIGGRDRAKAQRLCDSLPGKVINATHFDRRRDAAAQLAALKPWAVIDAAGPFQDMSTTRYAVPEACIRRGIHYIDLADSRTFVTGIGILDDAARAAGVAVISGASSVPALSTAVADALASDLADTAEVDIAISASNQAIAGPNVNTAILSYVGQPIRYLAAGAWRQGYGWQCLARKCFDVAGRAPVRDRLVGLCDVPDLDLLPRRFPAARNVIFRAGAELSAQNLALWLLSFAVRWNWSKSLAPLAPLLNRLQAISRFLGSDRSAMSVGVTGHDDTGKAIQRRWTLIAEDGHGPWVPSLAAVLLIEKLAAGDIRPGAGPAIGRLTLDDFAPLFARFHLFMEVSSIELPKPLYVRVLGPAFARLPRPVQIMHDFIASDRAAGRGSVSRGRDPIARLIGWLFRFPPAQQDVPVTVTFQLDDGREAWHRDFAGYRFSSCLRTRCRRSETILSEYFGPLGFDFDLLVDGTGLEMKIRAWRILGLPMPRWLAPRIFASETARDDRFHFDVRLALPWGALIVHYAGWLALENVPQMSDKFQTTP